MKKLLWILLLLVIVTFATALYLMRDENMRVERAVFIDSEPGAVLEVMGDNDDVELISPWNHEKREPKIKAVRLSDIAVYVTELRVVKKDSGTAVTLVFDVADGDLWTRVTWVMRKQGIIDAYDEGLSLLKSEAENQEF